MLTRLHKVALVAAALAIAGCTHIGTTKRFQTSGAPTGLKTVAVEFVTPKFNGGGPAADAALVEWAQIGAVAKDVTPRVFARAQVNALILDEHQPALTNSPEATCRYVLVITLSKASASVSRGYHNENARIMLIDRQAHKTTWDADTYIAGGAKGFQEPDVDKFLVSVIAAMHQDGVFEHTAD